MDRDHPDLARGVGDQLRDEAEDACDLFAFLQQQVGGYRAELPHSGDMEMWMRFAAHAPVGVLRAVPEAWPPTASRYHRRQGPSPSVKSG